MFVGRRIQAAVGAGEARATGHGDPSAERTATAHLLRGPAAVLAACACTALAMLASTAPAEAQGPPSILVFHDGSDAVTDAGITAIQDLGTDNGFDVTASDDPADISAANLNQYAAVVFLDADGDVLPQDAQVNALRNYVQAGHGFLGIGATAEAENDSSFFDGLVGARPAEPCPPEPEPGQICSPTGDLAQVVAFGDRVHPATGDLPLELTRTDQWYRWQDRPTGQVHTLARWRAPNDPAGDGTDVGGTDHPVSWCRDFQGGRSFYTGMGRTAGSYSEPEIQQHLLGAIQWSAGLLRADCKATISSNYEGERLVDGTSGDLTHTGESHGLTIAPNGWVIYIGRGDCRTNEQRGEVAGLAGPTPRILDFDDPNVGVGCGNVHIFDPAEHDGTVNSGTTLAGIIPVYGDRGGGSEINGKIEAGLLGITLAPDFSETGHIYVQYFPTFNPDNPNLPGLDDGVDRRRTKMHTPRISRFTIDMETKELDLDSEVVIFEYESQIYSCCHRGGGMGFDSEGNLYVTTGDSNSSGGTNGYSGNNPPPKCPMRNPSDPDQESANNDDCGELNYSYQDARRTAGSTNDYNGKMLRFNPIDDIPDGEQPEIGVGTTYELPTADSPNGPNLFDGTEGDGNQAKPEIYAMGLRNPSRLSIDPETDIPYSAWVGPDAGGPNAQQGPSTYENAAQIAQAGNYGWPYCMGNQQAYRDRLADGSLRSSNEAGFVSGGPSGSPIQGFYDCDNLVNNSPNNTGLTVLPHETGTGMDAGTARPTNVWYSRGNEGGANGCPDFPREQGPDGAPNYGAAPTQLCPYATASGATIFDGPVYRYPDATADPSVAFPQYWDGRWFLQDFGNNSVKHGLLLDPDTDQDGGQPVYADSLRGVLNWGASYMDSKFAPDGSYYVQVYDGFFTTGNNAGLYRFVYTGGGPTPGADPQWEGTGNPREIQFGIGASGGVSYEWDFEDDGSVDSTDPDPVHTFETDGPHDVALTVTYADDQTDSKTITVNVQGDDTAPPTTAVQLNGADPVETYDGPVEVTLTADDAGGTGVEVIRYAVDGGDFIDYTEPFTVSGDGEHTVEYRSRDVAGNVEETQSVSFTIETEGGGGDSCDEFDGTELDPKWEIVNPSATNPPTVSGDHLNMPIIPGDLFGGNGTAQMILQGVPTDESWVLTAKIAHGAIDTDGEAAGLALVNRFDPNHFAKTALQYKNDTGGGVPGVWAERVLTADSQAITLPGETVPFPNSGALDFEGDYGWVRFVHDVDAQEIGTWTSTDGETFVNFGENMPVDEYLSEPGGLRAGVFAKHDGTGDDVVQIDAFNVVVGSADPQTPPDECESGGGDNTAPTTTATTDPADPDGENGWFLGDVEVGLDATDNPGGSGVDSTEYSIDGGEFQPYSDPFTVSGDGQHTVEYRSTDVEGNVEATKLLNLKIDSSPPETTATAEGEDPVEVTLEADDGPEGSGVALTEFRIDGGEWQEYVSEQTILGSEADLGNWAQAGPGGLVWMDDEGGFARTEGGLGMPWYPVREFGDFSLKMEWRDSSGAGAGNSGVFVRFPDPRIPLANRPTSGPGDWDGEYCGRTGSAATQPAWVAIYCGQEIQINDHQGDTQKTGSIYNFAPVEDPDHMGQPKGTWVEYEIRVEGQQYTILRNGEVLNEFDNSIPLDSSRGGDPPTQARQFSSGYIGLQNHGGPDVIDFRNVRVLPLDEGTVEGPIVIEGGGEHTVEFRSTDAAGNVEEIQELTVGEPGETTLRGEAKPKRKAVKPGKKARFNFTVRNRGDEAATGLRLCVKAPRRHVKVVGAGCKKKAGLPAGRSTKAVFKLKAKRSAAGKKVKIRFVANAANASRVSETAALKVKEARRKKR